MQLSEEIESATRSQDTFRGQVKSDWDKLLEEKESTVSLIDLHEFCSKRNLIVPDQLKNLMDSAIGYKHKFTSNPLFRIHALMAYWEIHGQKISPRSLSESMWGLAEACHIVIGSATPSRYGNNKNLQMEKDVQPPILCPVFS